VNCVVQLDSNTFGAVFGYSNAVGGAVTLGVGPRNSFSGGQSDLGQPILFVPGQVPTATFQTFPTGAQLTWTLGQHSAVASASSPACSTPLATALVQLFTPTNDSRAVQQLTQNLLSNPRFPAYMAAVRARFTSLSPFQSALLDAMDLLIANADLVADPATLSPAQLARLANLRAQLLSNPAVVRLRLAGDAMRAQPQALQCDAVSVINRNQPLQPLVPAQSGSLYSSALALANSPALHNVQTTLAGVLTGDQSSAVLAASGLLLSATLSEADLLALELPGPILTSLFGNILSVIGGAVAGALIGAAGGPVGAIGGAIAGGTAAHFAYNDSGECAPCNVDCEACAGECCIDGQPLGIDAQFLTGDSCGSSGTPCLADTDCGPDALCAQFCCMGILDLCPGNHCSSDADCSGLNTCQIGCCAGPCGQRGTTCNVVVASACGVSTTGCSGNETCERGCCSVEPPH